MNGFVWCRRRGPVGLASGWELSSAAGQWDRPQCSKGTTGKVTKEASSQSEAAAGQLGNSHKVPWRSRLWGMYCVVMALDLEWHKWKRSHYKPVWSALMINCISCSETGHRFCTSVSPASHKYWLIMTFVWQGILWLTVLLFHETRHGFHLIFTICL